MFGDFSLNKIRILKGGPQYSMFSQLTFCHTFLGLLILCRGNDRQLAMLQPTTDFVEAGQGYRLLRNIVDVCLPAANCLLLHCKMPWKQHHTGQDDHRFPKVCLLTRPPVTTDSYNYLCYL